MIDSSLTFCTVIYLLSPATIGFPSKPSEYAASPLPSLNDWQQLWTAWDVVTKSMLPRDQLLNKPIELRNDFIFYLGHIPTFAGKYFPMVGNDHELMWSQISISPRPQRES